GGSEAAVEQRTAIGSPRRRGGARSGGSTCAARVGRRHADPDVSPPLADGRGAFFKAVDPSSNDFARAAHAREERAYRELGDLITPWAPAFYGAFQRDAWHVLLLEDLGPKSAPPWTPTLARRVVRAYGDFHRATLGLPLPSWLPRSEQQ